MTKPWTKRETESVSTALTRAELAYERLAMRLGKAKDEPWPFSDIFDEMLKRAKK